jgi:hypothetical protein
MNELSERNKDLLYEYINFISVYGMDVSKYREDMEPKGGRRKNKRKSSKRRKTTKRRCLKRRRRTSRK